MHELIELLDPRTGWPHWAFELVSGAVIGATLSPLWRWALRRHDRKRHPAGDPLVTMPMLTEMFRFQSTYYGHRHETLAKRIRELELRNPHGPS